MYVELFEDAAGAWRWRERAANGQVISTSGESFTRRWSARRAAKNAHPGVEIRVKR